MNAIEIEIKMTEILERAKQRIKDNLAANGINASGRTSRSFRVERYDGGVRLVMGGTAERTAPLSTLEVGRPGGNVPGGFRVTKAGVVDVSNTFKGILIQWAREKHIPDFGWAEATILGRRIAEQGTNRHRNPVDVYSSVVLDAVREAGEEVVKSITAFIHDNIN